MLSAILQRSSAKKFLTPSAVRFMSSRSYPITKTVDSHTPPTKDDSVEGRYATVLFTCASKVNSLHIIYDNMKFISELYEHTEAFRVISKNTGLTMNEVKILNSALNEVGDFDSLTTRFIEVLCENKRLNNLAVIAEKYQKMYQELNKEEKMTIYSHVELDHDQKNEVLAALKQNPANEGKNFILEFEVDKTIKGGLVLYTETEYMDMSLASRINRIRQEVNSLTN